MSAPLDTVYRPCALCEGRGGRHDYIMGDPGAWVVCHACRGWGVEGCD